MLRYLISKKLRSEITNLRDQVSIFRIFLFLCSLLNSVTFIYLSLIFNNEQNKIFIHYLNFFVLGFVVLKDFFPIIHKLNLFKFSQYPITNIERSFLIFICEDLSLFNIAIICNMAIITISPTYDFVDFLNTFLFLISGVIISKIIRFIALNWKNLLNNYIISSGFVIAAYYFLVPYLGNLALFNYSLFIIDLLLIYLINKILNTKTIIHASHKRRHQSWSRNILMHKYLPLKFSYIKRLLIYAFVISFVILVFSHFTENYLLSYLSFSSLIYFTYVFNNYFGINYSYFSNYLTKRCSYREFFSVYFASLLFVVSIDLSIKLSYLILIGSNEISNYLNFYFITLLFFSGFSYFSSFFFAKKISKNKSILNQPLSTSGMSSLVSMAVFVLAYFYNFDNNIYLGLFFIISVSAVGFLKFNLLRYKLYSCLENK